MRQWSIDESKNYERDGDVPPLFDGLDDLEAWRQEWQDMPECKNEEMRPYKSLIVHFETRADMEAFARLVEQRIGFKTPSIYYPPVDYARVRGVYRYAEDD